MNRENLPFDLELDREPDCLSDLVIDRLLAGELAGTERDRVEAHLASCDSCGARRTALAGAAERFPEELFVAGLAARTARVARGGAAPAPARIRRRTYATGGIAAALAAAAAVGLFVLPGGDELPGSTVRAKGADSLAVFALRGGEVDRLLPGEPLAPGDAVRFEVRPAERAWVLILGLDAGGAVTAYAGGEDGGVRLDPGATLLPGSIVLDDTPGTERLVALFCERPVDATAAIRAGETALARAGGDPERAPALELAGCRQTSLAFRKELR